MNYYEITKLALDYADRATDPELRVPDDSTSDVNDSWLVNRMLRVVEARINRGLQNRNMCKRAYIKTVSTIEYYGLPPDFAGLRDIEVRPEESSGARITLEYATTEYMNKVVRDNIPGFYYTIINKQLQIHPKLDGYVMEVLYYQTIRPLTSLNRENWVSDRYPDLYLEGLMTEICAYTKDADAAAMWRTSFENTLAGMEQEDAIDRWSGPSLTMRLV